jgi:outer membrane biosynthesis protein TonB
VVPVPPTHRAAQGGSKAPVYAGVIIALAGVGVAAWIGMLKKPSNPPPANVVSATPSTEPVAKTPSPPPENPPVSPETKPAPAASVAPAPSEAPAPAHKGPASKTAERPAKGGHEALPAEVAGDLDAAEKALGSGDPANALHLARRTLGVQKSGRAFAVITRVYCRQGDLGNAKATFQQVPPALRQGVVHFCKMHDVDLR